MLRVIWYSTRKENGVRGICVMYSCKFCVGEGIDIVSHYRRSSRRIYYCQWSGHISPVLRPDPRWGRCDVDYEGSACIGMKQLNRSDALLSPQYPKCLVLAVFLVLTHTVGARTNMARSSGAVVSAALREGGWRTVILPFSISVLSQLSWETVFSDVAFGWAWGGVRNMSRISGAL
jgi:hypothetical protein